MPPVKILVCSLHHADQGEIVFCKSIAHLDTFILCQNRVFQISELYFTFHQQHSVHQET